jgi:hypothetical protein
MVVIPDGNQVAQLEVTSQRARLARDTLHQAAIAKEAVCVVVNKLVTRLVECGRGVSLSNGKTDSVGDTLAKRTSGDLNAGGIVSLGMAGCDAVNVLVGSPSQHLPLDTSIDPAAYTEGLEIVKGEVIAIEVKESILEHASVAVREDESVTVVPLGVLGVEPHEPVPEDVCDRSHAHRGTGVAGVGIGRGIGSQNTDRVDGELVSVGERHLCYDLI